MKISEIEEMYNQELIDAICAVSHGFQSREVAIALIKVLSQIVIDQKLSTDKEVKALREINHTLEHFIELEKK